MHNLNCDSKSDIGLYYDLNKIPNKKHTPFKYLWSKSALYFPFSRILKNNKIICRPSSILQVPNNRNSYTKSYSNIFFPFCSLNKKYFFLKSNATYPFLASEVYLFLSFWIWNTKCQVQWHLQAGPHCRCVRAITVYRLSDLWNKKHFFEPF